MAKAPMKVWADELTDLPLKSMEPFYLACSLRFGDPDVWLLPGRITNEERDFYNYINDFFQIENFPTKKYVMSGYIIWYETEKLKLKLPTVDTRRKTT